ncbi:MAG: DUF1080 domain-containing protein [Verrucomicrobiae bacterium]|nr:DUF1080 domain-containing protein [Verrucomicrobiae bacterium]
MSFISKTSVLAAVICAVGVMSLSQLQAQPDPKYGVHDRTRPVPQSVESGYKGTLQKAPSDAVVLFDGSNLDQWVADNGKKTKWVVKDGSMECVPGSGYVRTKESFGDCQLHVEWAAPANVEGEDQGRGNSGVFLGGGRYEMQVLDTYNNTTYADGYAAAIYGQYPPAVNPVNKPGEWNEYDIIYVAPRFEGDKLKSPARVTIFFNGVLVQLDRPLTGPTGHMARPPYTPHDVRQPIAFQDHGNPVKFRNVWIRELNK